MNEKKGQFGAKVSLGQPFRVSIILRQESRNKRTKRNGRTHTQFYRRKIKRLKKKNKSGQDYGSNRLKTRKSANKRDDRKANTGRKKMQQRSGKSGQDIRRAGRTTREKTK